MEQHPLTDSTNCLLQSLLDGTTKPEFSQHFAVALWEYEYDFQSSPLLSVIKDFIAWIYKRIAQLILKCAPDADISEQVNDVQDLITCTVAIMHPPSIDTLKSMLTFVLFCCMVYKKLTKDILSEITKARNSICLNPKKLLSLPL